jgi:hypothetical protein
VARISLKAFVIGNALAFILSFGLLLAMMMILLLGSPHGTDIQSYKTGLSHDIRAVVAEAMLTIIAFLATGYITARLAGHDLLLNSTLASVGFTIGNIYTLLKPHANPFHHPLLTVVSWSVPLLTLLGGWIAQGRQSRQL